MSPVIIIATLAGSSSDDLHLAGHLVPQVPVRPHHDHLRQDRRKSGGEMHPRRREIRLAGRAGLRLHLAAPPPDRRESRQRALQTEHPHQRAVGLHGRRLDQSRDHGQRRPNVCSGRAREAIAELAKDIIFGQLRLVIASMMIEEIKRRPRNLPARGRGERGGGTQEDRP